MSDYMIVNGELCHADDELKHYGVKGMKWGVRRAIGKQARDYARDYYDHKKMSKKSSRLGRRIDKLNEKGKNADKVAKLTRRKKDIDKAASRMAEIMSKKASTLSDKDIAQGKREVVTGKIAKATFAIGMTALGAYTGIASSASTIQTITYPSGRVIALSRAAKVGKTLMTSVTDFKMDQ